MAPTHRGQGGARRRWPPRSSATSRALRERIAELGADPFEAMAPFSAPIDEFHAPHRAVGLVRGPGQGLRRRRARRRLLPRDRGLPRHRDPRPGGRLAARTPATPTSSSTGCAPRSRPTPGSAGRLALWGRRLMGEALTQAQRVAAERDALTALLAGGVDRPGLDLAAIGRMFTRLTERHAERMAELGLDSLRRPTRGPRSGLDARRAAAEPAAALTRTAATTTCQACRHQSKPGGVVLEAAACRGSCRPARRRCRRRRSARAGCCRGHRGRTSCRASR